MVGDIPISKNYLNVKRLIHKKILGFLTNKNRFLNRKEAAILAKENGQYSGNNISLYSEDLDKKHTYTAKDYYKCPNCGIA